MGRKNVERKNSDVARLRLMVDRPEREHAHHHPTGAFEIDIAVE